MRYYLILPPSTQEDEGRFQLLGAYSSMERADAERQRRATESKGYYKPSSFEIAATVDA